MLCCELVNTTFIMLRYASCFPRFYRGFITRGCWTLQKVFCLFNEIIIWFLFITRSIHLVYNMYWFMYIEPLLHLWNEVNLFTLNDLLFLNLVCKDFIENFVFMFIKGVCPISFVIVLWFYLFVFFFPPLASIKLVLSFHQSLLAFILRKQIFYLFLPDLPQNA